MEHLKEKYNDTIRPKLLKNLNLKNIHQIPKISKIVVNRGLGEAALNSNILNNSLDEISLLTGQRGVFTRSKKAIAAFKLRSKIPIGISVTLRDDRMYAFLDRFITLALPRIRDFQGVNCNNFDGQGNYSVGLEEQLMFPEIDYNKIDKSRGMNISIVTTAKNNHMALTLLKEFNMPFSKNKK